jgi:D-aminoacyl-tRNA deacylase
MRIVLQRVSRARVEINQSCVGEIGRGFLLLVAAGPRDTADDLRWLAHKIAGLRVFPDAEGRMNLPLSAVKGKCLAVSQFTLYGDCRKGFRPGFTGAADPQTARGLFDLFVEALRDCGLEVETGRFQEEMVVLLENEGPVTLLLEREEGQCR